MIPVTKSYLPPIEEYMFQIQRAYDNQWLTNRGELVQELEQKLSDYLELKESKILCMNNGTIPLQIALRLLGNNGEIITTPFSYVATTAAIVWENCTPVFVDIHPEYLTIDETKIEAAITDKTTCILATHVFGNPCHIEEIERIANKHNLKVIYDAAHASGVKYNGKSIFDYGDASTCSFHATKLFHTGEGGAIFSKNTENLEQLFRFHNFGHTSSETFFGVGINGKMSEIQAAMGLSVLPYLSKIINQRKLITAFYKRKLLGNSLQFLKLRSFSDWNYSYFPIIFETEVMLLTCVDLLNQNNIFPRRYFYPSLNTIDYVKGQSMPISESISKRILCLPLYFELEENQINTISDIIIESLIKERDNE